MARVLLPLAQLHGVAILVVDHKTKAEPEHRYPKGSGDKLARAEVAYNLSAPEPYSRERSGRLHVRCTKDRPGYIGRDTSWMVYVDVDSEEGQIELDWGEPLSPDETRRMSEELRNRERGPTTEQLVLELLPQEGDSLGVGELAEATGKDPSAVRRALRKLGEDGRAESDDSQPPKEKRWWRPA